MSHSACSLCITKLILHNQTAGWLARVWARTTETTLCRPARACCRSACTPRMRGAAWVSSFPSPVGALPTAEPFARGLLLPGIASRSSVPPSCNRRCPRPKQPRPGVSPPRRRPALAASSRPSLSSTPTTRAPPLRDGANAADLGSQVGWRGRSALDGARAAARPAPALLSRRSVGRRSEQGRASWQADLARHAGPTVGHICQKRV